MDIKNYEISAIIGLLFILVTVFSAVSIEMNIVNRSTELILYFFGLIVSPIAIVISFVVAVILYLMS